LRALDILPETQDRGVTTLFAWPLEQSNGLNDFGFHGISNFVDQNTAYPNLVLDYNCGKRTYDLSSGYNHRGTDIFLWPFAWYKMEHEQVKVVAAAAGVIVYKSDGNFDKNCSFNSLDWNSVDIQHADGSIAWYGHMKNGSLTNKAVGESVEAGEYLGIVGSSGSSTAPHLHFEVYEAGGSLIDPYAGDCNSLNTESWWLEQRPYYDSGLNALRTHSDPPVFPVCPEIETLNESDQFCIGDVVYYTAYYRDQLPGQEVSYKVFRPNNTIYQQWNQTFDTFYPASWWYWYFTLPAGAQTGVWKFQVTYEGEVYEKYFDVNGSTHIAASGNTTFCEGEEITLTAPAAQFGFDYQWEKNGVNIPGSTNATLAVSESGNYTCSISTVNGCSTISNTIAVIVDELPQAIIDPPGPISICEGYTVNLCASGGTTYTWNVFGAEISTTDCIDVNYTGDFTVQVQNDNGCSSLAYITVTVLPSPVVDLGDDIIFLTGADTVLNAEGPGLTYLWSTGETTSSIIVSQDGFYSVTVTDGNGCEAIDEVEVMGSSATSNANKVDGLNVYPNPVSDWLTVDLGSNENLPVSISFVDMCGKIVWTSKAESAMIKIPVGQLVAGVYFLRAELKHGTHTRMIVISR
jgi:murein DD-endopeptidase MepM/ murein hydrolase activator NlpD